LQIAVSSWADIADLRLRLFLSDRGVPLVTGVNGTLMARREVISSVGHPSGYPGFLWGGKGLPAGPIEASPCRPTGFRGRALPARARR
jgi:hypothetical protein